MELNESNIKKKYITELLHICYDCGKRMKCMYSFMTYIHQDAHTGSSKRTFPRANVTTSRFQVRNWKLRKNKELN